MTSRQIGWSQESNLLYEIGKQLDILAKVLANSGKGSLEAYPDLASFPPVGVPGVIYLAEDTGYIYYWDGASYIQFGGGSYVPTSRQLTINGVTFDLSADRTWTINTGDDIIVVANYSALPAPNTVTGQFYWCSNPQGTAWLPGSVGGTYYNSGLYYSNGTTWEFLNVPYQATQSEVNAGIITDKFVTPNTLFNSSQWGTKENPLTFSSPLSRSTNTVSIPAATSSVNGYLSSTDWSTFNGKQGALTLTTTGTSGAATLVGNTLNIPQYSGGGGMAIGGSITSATAGSVLFAGTSGVLAQNNANFFWDVTNLRLGIGTSSPTAPLTVFNSSSSSAINLQLVATGTQGINAGAFATMYHNDGSAMLSGSRLGGFLMGGARDNVGTLSNSIGIFAYADANWTSTSSPSYISFQATPSGTVSRSEYLRIFSTGNILIQNGGTFTDAGYRLDVNGTARIQGNLTTNLTIGSVPFIGTSGVLAQDNSNLFWDNTNKRLGIGTASPSYTFHISGANAGIFLTRTSPDESFIVLSNTALTSGAQIRGLATAVGMRITNQNGTTEWARFHSTGNFSINSNSDAGYKFDVSGTARIQDNLLISKNQNANTTLVISNTNSHADSNIITQYISDVGSGTSSIGKNSTLKTAYKSISAKDAYFYNGTTGGDITIHNDFATGNIKLAAGGSSTAQATLFSTGNLAIGTTTDAGFRLDVNGTMRVQGNMDIGVTAAASTITLPQSSGWTDFIISNNNVANTGIRFRNTAGTRVITIGGTNMDFSVTNGNFNAGTATVANLSLATITSTTIRGTNQGTLDLNGDNLLLYSRTGTASPVRILSGSATATSKGTVYISDYSNLTGTINASAQLQVDSTVQGFLPPRMTTTQKNAISSPAAGLVVYDTTLNKLCVYTTAWETITSA
jgi:hypothetical protein